MPCAELLRRRRHLQAKLDLAPGACGLERGDADLEIRHAPGTIVHRWRLAADGGVQLVQHELARTALGRQRDLRDAVIGVNEQAIGRLPDVAALATRERQSEKRLVRRARWNRGERAGLLGAKLLGRGRVPAPMPRARSWRLHE